jgi:choline dehydrogenase
MRYDYIIIGSGSAGGMIAARLSADPSINVLLLEAGGREGHWTIRMPAATRQNFLGGPRNWCFSTEPEPYMDDRRIFQPRGKVIGGSSSLNGMVYVRGHRQDFDSWRDAGATGWGYDNVLPYFRSLETYLPGGDDYRGDDGPIGVDRLRNHHVIETAFLDAVTEAGLGRAVDYNGAEQEGGTAFDVNIARGERSGTAALIGRVRHRHNLTILTGAHVTGLAMTGTSVTGATFLRAGRTETAHCDREVVLAAGAVQSPQILMLSGIGPAAQLRAHGIRVRQDLAGVGENLHDQLEVHIKHRCAAGLSQNKLLKRHRMLAIGLQWFLTHSGPAATTPSRVGAFLRSSHATYPDIQYHFWPYFLDGWSPPPDKDGYCFDVGPMRTESRGWVRLASDDPLAAPLMCLNGLQAEADRRVFRESVRMTREIAAQSAFDKVRGPEESPGPDVNSDADIDAFVRANANSAYHVCGTCRMGNDDLAVVSPDLHVHGIEGLRIADASIMPTITNGNLNAPSLMIGEKAAAMILDDHRRRSAA